MAKFITARQAAVKLGVRLPTLYSLLWDETITGKKTEGVWMVDVASLDSYNQRRATRENRVKTQEPIHATV